MKMPTGKRAAFARVRTKAFENKEEGAGLGRAERR